MAGAQPPNPSAFVGPPTPWPAESSSMWLPSSVLWARQPNEIDKATNAQMVVQKNDLIRNAILTPGIEIGSTGLKRWGGRVYQEFLPELRGIRGMRTYDEMRKSDPVIGAILNAVKSTVRSVSWSASPADSSAESLKWADFLEQCMDDMEMTWEDFISDALTVIPFGWALFESVLKVRAGEDAEQSSDYDDGLIGWQKLALRLQESLYIWDIDNYGEIHGIVQMPPPDFRQRYIPLEKCILLRLDREGNNPEGVSMLRPCYRPWYFKKNLEEVEGIGIERDFTGLMRIRLPVNATESDHRTAQGILDKAKVDEMSGIKLGRGPDPSGRDDWDMDLVSSPGSKSIDVDKAIARYKGEMAMTFLAQFLQLGSQGGRASGGSYALARSHKDFFYLAVQAIVDEIGASVQRQAVKPLMRWNNVPTEYRPSLAHGQIAPREMDALISALDLMVRDGLLGEVTPQLTNFIRGEMGVPLIDIEGGVAPTEDMREESQTSPEEPGGPISTAAFRTGQGSS